MQMMCCATTCDEIVISHECGSRAVLDSAVKCTHVGKRYAQIPVGQVSNTVLPVHICTALIQEEDAIGNSHSPRALEL